MKKPYIYISGGWWVCKDARRTGYGSTPLVAYAVWAKQ